MRAARRPPARLARWRAARSDGARAEAASAGAGTRRRAARCSRYSRAVPRSARSSPFIAAQAICSGWRSRVSESSDDHVRAAGGRRARRCRARGAPASSTCSRPRLHDAAAARAGRRARPRRPRAARTTGRRARRSRPSAARGDGAALQHAREPAADERVARRVEHRVDELAGDARRRPPQRGEHVGEAVVPGEQRHQRGDEHGRRLGVAPRAPGARASRLAASAAGAAPRRAGSRAAGRRAQRRRRRRPAGRPCERRSRQAPARPRSSSICRSSVPRSSRLVCASVSCVAAVDRPRSASSRTWPCERGSARARGRSPAAAPRESASAPSESAAATAKSTRSPASGRERQHRQDQAAARPARRPCRAPGR